MKKAFDTMQIAKYLLFLTVVLCLILYRQVLNKVLLVIALFSAIAGIVLDIVSYSMHLSQKGFSPGEEDVPEKRDVYTKIEKIQNELKQKNEELEVIRDVAGIITSTLEVTELVEYLYKVLSKFTDCDRYFICLHDKETEKLICRYEYGDVTFDEVGRIYDEVTSVMKCFRRGQIIKKINTFISVRDCYGDKMSIPMNASGELVGVIFIESGKQGTFSKVNLEFLESLTRYAAIGIINAELFNDTYLQKQEIESLYEEAAAVNEELNSYIDELNRAENELREKNAQLTTYYREIQTGYLQTVTALANSIQAKDAYTMGHCQRVMKISCDIANCLHFSNAEMQKLKYSAILHDIGKIGIRASILNKKGKLTTDEYNEIKKHPLISYNILKDIEFIKEGLNAILQHHERYDGTGYPYGLRGNEISIYGRILCIADAFDAMTSDRPYRAAMSVEEALKEIDKCKGTQFDPEISDLFLDMMANVNSKY